MINLSISDPIDGNDKIELPSGNVIDYSISFWIKKETIASDFETFVWKRSIASHQYCETGTTNEFYEFDADVKGSIEGHLGRVNYFTSDEYDANQNYQSDGGDLTSRIEREVEILEQQFEDKPSELYQKPSDFLKYFNVNVTQKEIDDSYGDERAVAELIASKKLLEKMNPIVTIKILPEDIVTAAGGTFTSVDLELNPGLPIEFYALSEGEKAKLNSISFL